MKSLLLIVDGGHCNSCIDVIETTITYKIKGVVDSKASLKHIFGYPVIGSNEDLPQSLKVSELALVEHGVEVHDHCHISTGALINGDVTIGKGSFIGSGATFKERVRVGNNVVVGAGQVVLRDVPDGAVVKHES